MRTTGQGKFYCAHCGYDVPRSGDNDIMGTAQVKLPFRLAYAAVMATIVVAPHWALWPLFFCVGYVATIDPAPRKV